MVGVWSDKYGRRPFLIAGICGAAMPISVIYLHVQHGVSFYWFYPASVATSGISIISVTLAYISDSISPPNRASAFGLVLASFSLGILIGPIVGAFVSMGWGINLSMLAVLLSLLATFLFVPESFQRHDPDEPIPDPTERKAERTSCKLFSSIEGLSILCRSKLFAMLAVCAMIAGICQEAIQDLLLQYLQIKLDFVSRDQGIVLGIFGAGGLLVQVLVLPLLLAAVGVKHLLVIGLVATMLQQFCMAFVVEKWQVYLTIGLGTIGSVSFPAISSIKANNASSSEQGTVQGALFGARALAQGIGPVMGPLYFRDRPHAGCRGDRGHVGDETGTCKSRLGARLGGLAAILPQHTFQNIHQAFKKFAISAGHGRERNRDRRRQAARRGKRFGCVHIVPPSMVLLGGLPLDGRPWIRTKEHRPGCFQTRVYHDRVMPMQPRRLILGLVGGSVDGRHP
eukprot:scaffold566_cov364-Pavlova_lutheri.AAC.6